MAMARKSVLSAKDAAVNPPVAMVLRYTRAGSELPHQTAEAALRRSFFGHHHRVVVLASETP